MEVQGGGGGGAQAPGLPRITPRAASKPETTPGGAKPAEQLPAPETPQQTSPPATATSNELLPAPTYRMGYVDYLRAAGLGQVAAGSPAAQRWAACHRDQDKIIGLADAGKRDEAVAALTGIRRGDAAFDFSYFDDAVGRIATARQAAFDNALHSTRTLLTGWTEIPLGVAVLVLMLVPLGVRKRLAEYR